jgi:hypothetical protein
VSRDKRGTCAEETEGHRLIPADAFGNPSQRIMKIRSRSSAGQLESRPCLERNRLLTSPETEFPASSDEIFSRLGAVQLHASLVECIGDTGFHKERHRRLGVANEFQMTEGVPNKVAHRGVLQQSPRGILCIEN